MSLTLRKAFPSSFILANISVLILGLHFLCDYVQLMDVQHQHNSWSYALHLVPKSKGEL